MNIFLNGMNDVMNEYAAPTGLLIFRPDGAMDILIERILRQGVEGAPCKPEHPVPNMCWGAAQNEVIKIIGNRLILFDKDLLLI